MIVHLQNQPLPGMHPLAHPLYCLTSDDVKPSHAVQVDQMVKAGIKLIQVRSKTNFSSFHLDQLKVSISKARALGVCVIINDDYLLSEALGANGVHLGKYDSLPSETRLEPDRDIIIGRTVHSLEDAQDVKSLGFCNYVGIGPYEILPQSLICRLACPFRILPTLYLFFLQSLVFSLAD